MAHVDIVIATPLSLPAFIGTLKRKQEPSNLPNRAFLCEHDISTPPSPPFGLPSAMNSAGREIGAELLGVERGLRVEERLDSGRNPGSEGTG